MNKKSFVAPILISIFALIAVPVSVSAVTQRSSEINVCVDWDYEGNQVFQVLGEVPG